METSRIDEIRAALCELETGDHRLLIENTCFSVQREVIPILARYRS